MTPRAKGSVHHVLAGFLCAACIHSTTQALNLALSERDIERAQKIASGSDSSRARFHALYVQQVNDATLEQIEVITEFRRCVMLTEERLRLGDWIFARGVRAVGEAMRPYRGRVSVVARLRFHPQNTFGTIPEIQAAIGASGRQPVVGPLDVIRTRIDQLQAADRSGHSDRAAPLMGALVETVFDAASVGDTERQVSVLMDGRSLALVAVDFSRFE